MTGRWEISSAPTVPSVALEAGMMARPIVATRVGGAPEIVVDHETGLLIESENCDALANATAFLLRRPATAIELGRAARHRVRKCFGFHQYVERYETLYKKLAAPVDAAFPVA